MPHVRRNDAFTLRYLCSQGFHKQMFLKSGPTGLTHVHFSQEEDPCLLNNSDPSKVLLHDHLGAGHGTVTV